MERRSHAFPLEMIPADTPFTFEQFNFNPRFSAVLEDVYSIQ